MPVNKEMYLTARNGSKRVWWVSRSLWLKWLRRKSRSLLWEHSLLARLKNMIVLCQKHRQGYIRPSEWVSLGSRQDDLNPALWLATWAGKMELSCLLGTTCILQEKIPWKPYNKPFIDQACSVKMTGYWPCSFLGVYGSWLHLGP